MGYSRQDYGDYMALPHRATVAIKLTHRERATLAVRWEEIKEHLIQTEQREDHTQIHMDGSVLIKEYVTRIVVAHDLLGGIKKKKKRKEKEIKRFTCYRMLDWKCCSLGAFFFTQVESKKQTSPEFK